MVKGGDNREPDAESWLGRAFNRLEKGSRSTSRALPREEVLLDISPVERLEGLGRRNFGTA
jgi:hypothetical protein